MFRKGPATAVAVFEVQIRPNKAAAERLNVVEGVRERGISEGITGGGV
jgi:hypothetical protein